MSILPGNKAPWFSSIGFQENKFMDISINDYTGKWLILFFCPLDFFFGVSPSELLELELRRPELESLNCRWYTINLILIMAFITSYPSLLAVSQDSVVVHEGFADLNPGYGGVFSIKFPLMEDKDGNISRLYGVDKAQAGHSFRTYFIIDPSQVLKYSLSRCALCKHFYRQTVRARVVNDLPVALSMKEMMRQVRSLKLVFTEEGKVDLEDSLLKVSIMLLFIIHVIDTDILLY